MCKIFFNDFFRHKIDFVDKQIFNSWQFIIQWLLSTIVLLFCSILYIWNYIFLFCSAHRYVLCMHSKFCVNFWKVSQYLLFELIEIVLYCEYHRKIILHWKLRMAICCKFSKCIQRKMLTSEKKLNILLIKGNDQLHGAATPCTSTTIFTPMMHSEFGTQWKMVLWLSNFQKMRSFLKNIDIKWSIASPSISI